MSEKDLILITFIIYGISTILYFLYSFKRKSLVGRLATVVLFIGLLFHTISLIIRSISAGHLPFSNMFESLSFLTWITVVAYLIIELIYKLKTAGGFVLLIILGLMAVISSPLIPKEISPLVPALQSHWLTLHVSVTLIGEAFLAIAFVTSILYLIQERKFRSGKKSRLSATPEELDNISYRCIAIGFSIFTLGALIFGMIWAYQAWGSYWSWDPKETWTLITWFIYALYLHTRIVMGWKGRRSAYIAILGFLSALFTYFGVNYLISGLHSYT
ncbi:c-type cytochrome biogenesis protein CcsB [Candidatus Aminicenantes bacterium AC-335-A11]|jgi:cytochrome c-type biogenesis protein CcsB|nr:c-type cytochrome biogenesis protein CcsB [SCandidatus Aminicenantes bacterium Aminicenantia_JdfR_composite]MCP2618980.1 c-type cytochrome biogenesis protein CcsB [Candidatus Aminicenantes bacterium AC-335-A11]MCP2621166.1 c-type cytochrome biogenesis protein CcsB [Candidatus Aminicenantes bacterium AC-334-E05]